MNQLKRVPVGLAVFVASLASWSGCTSTPCDNIGQSLTVTKQEVYETLQGDAGVDGGPADSTSEPDSGGVADAEVNAPLEAGSGADSTGTSRDSGAQNQYGNLPCPTSAEMSQYLAVRYQKAIDASRIGTPRFDETSCQYPITETVCETF